MPHVSGDPGDTEARPTGRIRGTQRLLTTAAVLMSVFLVTSSFVTTLLIPARQFQAGGHANGRALAYLAHMYLGNGFGTVYDASTIAILWFAGASAMAGMLNLIPRYLPRYGMSPEWAGAVRPLVLILTGAAFLITWIFHASVDGQGGAYATGVLVLFTSAVHRGNARRPSRGPALAAPSASPSSRSCFAYTTVSNVVERPDGVKIGACFIARDRARVVRVADQARLRAARDRDRLRRRQPGLRPRLCPPHHPPRRQPVWRARRRRVRREDQAPAPRPRPACQTPTSSSSR